MPRGRPTKLTPDLQERIVEAIRAGAYVETAAALAGVNKTTFYDWLRKGARAKRGAYHDFSLAVEEALAQSEADDLAVIEKAGRGYEVRRTKAVRSEDGTVETTVETSTRFDWQAAAWRLERRFPERWGRSARDLEARVRELQEAVNRLLEARGEKPNLKVAP
jgi:hypothetical protein